VLDHLSGNDCHFTLPSQVKFIGNDRRGSGGMGALGYSPDGKYAFLAGLDVAENQDLNWLVVFRVGFPNPNPPFFSPGSRRHR